MGIARGHGQLAPERRHQQYSMVRMVWYATQSAKQCIALHTQSNRTSGRCKPCGRHRKGPR